MQLVEPHQRELLHGAREVLCYLAVISLHRSTGEPASCVTMSKIGRHSSTVLSYTHCFAEFFQRHAYCSDIHQTERAMLLYLILITRRHSVNGVHYHERLFIDTSSLFKLFVTCWRSTSIESEQST